MPKGIYIRKPFLEETREKLRKANLGKHLSEETKRKIGLSNKGKPKPEFSEEHRKNMSLAHKGKHHSPETEFKKGQFLNEKSPFWKGDEAGYQSLHSWLRKNKSKPNICEFCGEEKELTLANIKNHKYTRNFEDYKWLCWSCHHIFDYNENGIIQIIQS